MSTGDELVVKSKLPIRLTFRQATGEVPLRNWMASKSPVAMHAIIGTHEHESHFVFDILHNNTTDIHPERHSTDTSAKSLGSAGGSSLPTSLNSETGNQHGCCPDWFRQR